MFCSVKVCSESFWGQDLCHQLPPAQTPHTSMWLLLQYHHTGGSRGQKEAGNSPFTGIHKGLSASTKVLTRLLWD